MSENTIRLLFSYLTALFIIGGTYYALVIYPYVLDSDVKLFLTGASGTAILFVFGDQVASRARSNTTEDLMTQPPAGPEIPS